MDRDDLINQLKNSFSSEEKTQEEAAYVERYNFDKKNYCRLVIDHNEKKNTNIQEFDNMVKVLLNCGVPECVSHAKNLHLYRERLQEKFNETELDEIKKEAAEISKKAAFGSNNPIFLSLQVDTFAKKVLSRFE